MTCRILEARQFFTVTLFTRVPLKSFVSRNELRSWSWTTHGPRSFKVANIEFERIARRDDEETWSFHSWIKKKKSNAILWKEWNSTWVFLYTFDEIVVVKTLRYLQIGRSKSRIRVYFFFSFYFFSPRSPTAESRGYLYTYIAVTSHGKPKKRSTTLLTATGVHSYL